MTCEEIARREEWNRIMAWLKGPPSRITSGGLRKIAKHLEETGIPCRGKRWHASTIASILRKMDNVN